mgnify:CR=1 FL=1
MAEYVEVEQDGRVAIVTLDHPPVNALSAGLLEELEDSYDELDRSDETRAIVIRGEGEHFGTGDDLPEMADLFSDKDVSWLHDFRIGEDEGVNAPQGHADLVELALGGIADRRQHLVVAPLHGLVGEVRCQRIGLVTQVGVGALRPVAELRLAFQELVTNRVQIGHGLVLGKRGGADPLMMTRYVRIIG